MIVVVQGTSSFTDYNVFLRAMGVAMSNLTEEDSELLLYSAGPGKINSMTMEFANLSDRGMKARGKKIKFFVVPPWWFENNMETVNYFAFFSKQGEPMSKLAKQAEDYKIEVGTFVY